MRKIGFLVLAAVLGIAGVVYALVPFTLTIEGAIAPERPTTTACSAPIEQVVDPPNPSPPDHGFAIHDYPPVCKDAGRSRALTSVVLFIASALAVVVALTGRRRDDSDSDEHAPSSVSSFSGLG
jgi:hypothetical protein